MGTMLDKVASGLGIKKTAPASTVDAHKPQKIPGRTTNPERLGWRIASFAADTLQPAPGIKTTSVAVWRAYLEWCRERKCVPLAIGVFHTRFDRLAREVGIGRFQNGAHVLYRDLTVKKA